MLAALVLAGTGAERDIDVGPNAIRSAEEHRRRRRRTARALAAIDGATAHKRPPLDSAGASNAGERSRRCH